MQHRKIKDKHLPFESMQKGKQSCHHCTLNGRKERKKEKKEKRKTKDSKKLLLSGRK